MARGRPLLLLMLVLMGVNQASAGKLRGGKAEQQQSPLVTAISSSLSSFSSLPPFGDEELVIPSSNLALVFMVPEAVVYLEQQVGLPIQEAATTALTRMTSPAGAYVAGTVAVAAAGGYVYYSHYDCVNVSRYYRSSPPSWI